ncbi:Free fatty acid receptor 3 [Bagarius yarrelli]|uniref:Free fatty acid receptor 3 n=1 Tax=Bagarius yarrelli TaxID=175774 RepID=A0A556U8M5_BAGYA|nr:Free fatty acid receptor 3 [Bagarius yarrelli]
MDSISVFECISLTVYSFTFLLGLPANLLVFFVYARKAQKHGTTPNVVYTINLCLSNLVLVAWMPVKSAYTVLEIWILPELLCPIYNFFVVASLYGSGLLLTAVALSVALVAEKGAYFVSPFMPNTSKCYENFTQEQLEVLLPLRLEMAVFMFAVPLLLSVFCTLRCLVLVKRSCLSAGSKRRILAMELSALMVFVVCYTPYNLSHVVGFITKSNVPWRREAIVSSCCNVFLEPVVMLMLSPSRSKDLLCKLCSKRTPKQHQQKDSMATKQRGTMSAKGQLGSDFVKAT